ncbi:MAG: helix-turn-helix domain-containing protein [Nitrospinota bacterium]
MCDKEPVSLPFDKILRRDLKQHIGTLSDAGNGGKLHSMVISIVEKSLIEVTLTETAGNQSLASHLLGVNRNTLRRKIKEHSIRIAHLAPNGKKKHKKEYK